MKGEDASPGICSNLAKISIGPLFNQTLVHHIGGKFGSCLHISSIGSSFNTVTIPRGMGGKEAAQNILTIDPEARFIVSSGYSNVPVLAEYSIAAVSNPYTVDKLMKTLGIIDKQG